MTIRVTVEFSVQASSQGEAEDVVQDACKQLLGEVDGITNFLIVESKVMK